VKAPSSVDQSLSVDVSVFICGRTLCLTTRGGLKGLPPQYIASWNVTDLRRFGLQNGLFCFDACNCTGERLDFDRILATSCARLHVDFIEMH
jgi:hypothetical protein